MALHERWHLLEVSAHFANLQKQSPPKKERGLVRLVCSKGRGMVYVQRVVVFPIVGFLYIVLYFSIIRPLKKRGGSTRTREGRKEKERKRNQERANGGLQRQGKGKRRERERGSREKEGAERKREQRERGSRERIFNVMVHTEGRVKRTVPLMAEYNTQYH